MAGGLIILMFFYLAIVTSAFKGIGFQSKLSDICQDQNQHLSRSMSIKSKDRDFFNFKNDFQVSMSIPLFAE